MRKARLWIFLIALAFAVVVLRPRATPWIVSLPLASPYPRLDRDAKPFLIRLSQLPALPGFKSPKPVVAADKAGNVVVVAHGFVDVPTAVRGTRGGGGGSELLVWRSADRGDRWNLPQNLTGRAADGEIAFDPWLETDGRGHYYLVYGLSPEGRVFVRRSKDAGQTWSDPLPIPSKGMDRPVLGISPNGNRLVVAGARTEIPDAATSKPPNGDDPGQVAKLRASIRFDSSVFVSNDHGDSWEKWPSPFGREHAIPFAVVIDDEDRVTASWVVEGGGSRSAVSLSEDRGQTWKTTTLVESLQPDRPHPFDGERFPVVALDGASGLHVAFVTAGARQLLTRRSVAGKGWSEPITLSNPSAEEVRMAAIDARGPMVHVTWVERNGTSWHAYYRGSRNSGESWMPTVRVSGEGTTSARFALHSDDDQSSVRDDGLGRVHAVWCSRGGDVWHAVLEWSARPPESIPLPNSANVPP
ncbi:sialidase family protein [Singulisphaera rosea]